MKRNKRFLIILLLLALVVSACGGGDATDQTPAATEPSGEPEEGQPEEGGETEEAPEPAGPFRVAVVLPSAINDLAFSQSMYDALTAIQEEMGEENFEFAHSENMFVVDDAAAAIRDYASEGYNLVIAHGSQYGSSVQEIAPDFPEVSFAWGTTADTFGLPNVFAYEAASDQGGYVNGVLAATLSQSGVLGVVGPIETGDAKLYVDGFVAGATATNPDIEVNVNYIGSFSDVALAAEAAQTHVNAGADAMTGSAQMVVGAIGVAEENDVLWFGTQSSQSSLAPDIVVANQVYDWTVVLNDMIGQIQGGTLGGESFILTLANGGLVMEYNEAYELPAEAREVADATVQGITDGSIVVGVSAPEEGEPPAGETPAAGGEGPVFGMVLVGPRNDHGWSQAHYEGGLYVEENLPGSRMIVFESLNPADKPEATLEGVVDDMVADGATLIFTTSDEFEEDTVGVAEKYPEVIFLNISGDDVLTGEAPPNEGNIMGRMEDMKAIAGCAAALASETGHIGYLGPLINFETRRLASSAYLGARYCSENYRGLDPDALQFTVTWIGFWFNIPGVTLDPTEVTNGFFDSGVDVVMSGIDTTEGIDVAGQRARQGDGVWAVPYDFAGACDQAPEICLGVPYFNWGPAYLETATAVANGTWEQSWDWNGANWEDLTDNTTTNVGWISGPALTEEMQASLDEFIAGLASGEINVWTGLINLQDGTEYIPAGEVATDEEIWYLPQLLEGMEGPSE
ncbi:MAG: BMP family ABC transporter substrate-binding protein [Chloroflexi bacterium]|nr:BMP family ABC transporter substrate-binding protein [Chloroflexota bacterium]MCI0578336.1 BMP family ABC transporter substrate-binding protein [Chloroflexota bacterium]MCI0648996.1 BMP family ABC transporter substrate-binding protein [Chloroflexota bacterium]MCI0729431.1 BMP family ABC transporter substrate-binding protein [Chloroflexota bacterium]